MNLVKMDDRGRLTLGKVISDATGKPPAHLWDAQVDQATGVVTLSPVTVSVPA